MRIVSCVVALLGVFPLAVQALEIGIKGPITDQLLNGRTRGIAVSVLPTGANVAREQHCLYDDDGGVVCVQVGRFSTTQQNFPLVRLTGTWCCNSLNRPVTVPSVTVGYTNFVTPVRITKHTITAASGGKKLTFTLRWKARGSTVERINDYSITLPWAGTTRFTQGASVPLPAVPFRGAATLSSVLGLSVQWVPSSSPAYEIMPFGSFVNFSVRNTP